MQKFISKILSLAVKNIQVNLIFLARLFVSLRLNLEDTFARYEKYSSKLDISRSLVTIFEINLEDTFARSNKYSSKLDISCSLICIFR